MPNPKKKTPEQRAAALLASKGGRSGTGASKYRGPEHQKKMCQASARVRAEKARIRKEATK